MLDEVRHPSFEDKPNFVPFSISVTVTELTGTGGGGDTVRRSPSDQTATTTTETAPRNYVFTPAHCKTLQDEK